MGIHEWRRFNFFDLKSDVDQGKLADLLKESEIVVTTSGNNNLVIGDSLGQIHLISRSWIIKTFRAYEVCITHAQQLRNSSYLITIGQDEEGINPLIKVWDPSRLDKNGVGIYLSRVSRTNAWFGRDRAEVPVVFCVHENMQLMAVGFRNGTLLLYREDVSREKGRAPKVLRENSSCVTGLAFKVTANTSLLYVATQSSIYIYNITQKDKEVMSMLDTEGASVNCTVLSESLMEYHFMVARQHAVYCYTSDGKGPCYVVSGEKVMLQCFRSYLVIVSQCSSTQVGGENVHPKSDGHLLTVLDTQNKFIVYSGVFNKIKAILNEWGGFYMIDHENKAYHLNEKDIQSKLALLFKKNLYDIGIRIAKSQHYDSDGLVDIFRQNGDHLYGRGDHSGAMDQYIHTIGKLEPSYVIRKYMDSKHTDDLTRYLQALHQKGHASEDHTTLLLNCFTKLNKTDALKEFILQKDRALDFDVDTAIRVCRQVSPAEALMLAKCHRKHDWYIKLQIEDYGKYADVIEYMASLSFEDAQHFMRKYGSLLIANAGNESTQFLMMLCTGFGVDQLCANAEDFIHLFLNDSERLVEFLDHLVEQGQRLNAATYDTLLEHYLTVWSKLENANRARYEAKILKLMKSADVKYDPQQALVACRMHNFNEGILFLYEGQKLYQQILRHHMHAKDSTQILACCRRFSYQDPTLWIQALWSCINDSDSTVANEILPEVLNAISKERLLSPQLVVEAVGTSKGTINLSLIKNYIIGELKKEQNVIARVSEQTEEYRKDNDDLKRKLDSLKNGAMVIQGSRCAACHHPLELPSLHFLCQHSYHQHCFQSYSDKENECVACLASNKKMVERLRAREDNDRLNESFHSILDKATDRFETLAEYFRRDVFNTIKIITNKPVVKRPLTMETSKSDVTSVTEGRIRMQENLRSQAIPAPLSEGRMRLQENKFHSSLEGNIVYAKPESKVVGRKGAKAAENKAKGDSYDESLNPFSGSDGEENDKNPFKDDVDDEDDDDDSYDKNLNPFYNN